MLLPPVQIGLSESGLRIHLFGGDPKTKDHLYFYVTKWPGWQRHPPISHQGVYSGPMTPYSCLLISKLRGQAPVEWRSHDVYLAIERMVDAIHDAERILKDETSKKDFKSGRRLPLPHQEKACHAILIMGGKALLADDMGLGKTTTSLLSTVAQGCSRTLVLCPASVLYNWEQEIRACIDDPNIILITGGPKKRADQFALLRASNTFAARTFVVVNYDKLAVSSEDHLKALAEFASDQALICDESHYLKNRSSERSKIVHKLFVNAAKEFGVPTPKVRLLLSGTPVQNTIQDLYSQVQIIRPGTWSSFSEFQKRYLTMVPIRVGNKLRFEEKGTKNLGELNAIMATVQIRRLKDEVISLPPKMVTYPQLELDPVTQKIYRAMKDWALLQLGEVNGDDSVLKPIIQNAMTAAIRCEQIAQGFCGGIPDHLMESVSQDLVKHAEKIPGRPGEVVFPQSSKMAWILETVNNLLSTGKVPVIFSRFNAPMLWLAEQFEGSLVLHGQLTMEARKELLQKYDEGACRVLFCQVRIAQGLNFVRSQDEIFIGRDWAPAINAQAEDRCHRIGQRGTVNIQIPITIGTIEERLHKRLQEKQLDSSKALAFKTVKDIRESL